MQLQQEQQQAMQEESTTGEWEQQKGPIISGKANQKPNASMIVTYPSGVQRQFGKSGYGKARKRENTRALYDDHELAALCSS